MINDTPYISQWDIEAKASKNDCGSVSLTMVLRKYGETHSADSIFAKTGAGQGYITFQQLINVAKSLGYNAEYKDRQSSDYLKSLLNQGLNPIALVQYGKLISVQNKEFKGSHLFVVTGYRDDGYFVNDPNFWGQFRADGKNHFYTKAEFESAWGATTTDGNTPNSLMIVYPKTPITPPGESIEQLKKKIQELQDSEKNKKIEFDRAKKELEDKLNAEVDKVKNLRETYKKEFYEQAIIKLREVS